MELSSVELSSVELSSVEMSSMELSSVELPTVELSSVELSSVELSSVELSSKPKCLNGFYRDKFSSTIFAMCPELTQLATVAPLVGDSGTASERQWHC